MNTQEIELKIDQNTKEKAGLILVSIEQFNPGDSEFIVNTQDEADRANAFLKTMKADFKFLEDKRVEIKKPALEECKAIDSFFKPYTDKLASGKRVIETGLSGFMAKQLLLQREAEARALEAARKEEEKRRAVIEARAKKAEESGRVEKAEDLRAQAEIVHIPAVPVIQVKKLDGTSFRVVKKARIVDITKIPALYYLHTPAIISEIQKIVNVFASKNVTIPGVEYYEENVLSVRS